MVIPDSVTSIGYRAFCSCSSLTNTYYGGTPSEWANIYIDNSSGSNNNNLTKATRYYYSEEHPTEEGNYWHWVDGEISVWCAEIAIDEAVEPTCTTKGLTEGRHCMTCGDILIEQNVIEATGHGKFVENTTVENTWFYNTTNSVTYPFSISENLITSTNKQHSSSATFAITATKSFILDLEYKVSSETNYDWLIIQHNSQEVVKVSGTSASSYTAIAINMAVGDTLTITYKKDGSQSSGNDCAYVRILTENLVYITEDNSFRFESCTEDVYCDICGKLAIEKIDHNYVDGTCTMCGDQLPNATPDEYFTFSLLEDDTYSIKAKNVNNMPSEVIIPNTYNGKAVTVIENSAFYECNSVISVVIPDSVISIGSRAFFSCDILASVAISDSVTYIGDMAFGACTSLASVVIPDSVTWISDGAFIECHSLTSVVIGDSVTYIGDVAFYVCPVLTSIEVNENNQYYKSINGNLYSKNGKTLIQYTIGKNDTSFEMPNSVTSISGDALYGSYSLTSVVIPDSVTSIGSSAFDGCDSLTDVYYTGTEEEWEKISIGHNNSALTNATIHYNYVHEE